jgi:hypothetical protein
MTRIGTFAIKLMHYGAAGSARLRAGAECTCIVRGVPILAASGPLILGAAIVLALAALAILLRDP